MIDRKLVYVKYNKHCAYCGCEIKFSEMQVDHKKPKHLGGTDYPENLMPSCRSCNATKATYTIEKFRKRLIEDVNRLRRDSSKYRVLERFRIVGQLKTELVFYFEV